MADPRIDIRPGESGLAITQHRPAVTGLLTGMRLTEALARIPTLLPICGNAQGIAAERAAAAARDEAEPDGARHRQRLNREQALAAAWRLTIDWPALCGQPPRTNALKAIRQTRNAEAMADGLRAQLPGLDRVRNIDALADWIAASPSPAAGLLREAMELESQAEPETDEAREFIPKRALTLCAGESLVVRVSEALGAGAFDPLQPAGAGIEVGPLAMARHPLITRIHCDERFGRLSRRLTALLLDTLMIVQALLDERADGPSDGRKAACRHAWNQGAGVGLGRAMTARGPVFHRVCLERAGEDHRVADWRVLAPTDWHFASTGPLTREATSLSLRGRRGLELLVAGFDPCAPWTVHSGANAHA